MSNEQQIGGRPVIALLISAEAISVAGLIWLLVLLAFALGG